MNRRGFLGLLAGAVAAPSVLLEPVRTIILPPRGGWPDFNTDAMRYKATERYGFVDEREFVGMDVASKHRTAETWWVIRGKDERGRDVFEQIHISGDEGMVTMARFKEITSIQVRG